MLDTLKHESIYQPEQLGFKFPEKPSFSAPAQERMPPMAAWLHFQPIWKQLVKTQPDMLS